VARPKYNVGDVVRYTNGCSYTIINVNPAKPKNFYTVIGARGGKYLCGDHNIVGLVSEVTETDARVQGIEKKFDLEAGRRHARQQAKTYLVWAAQWEKVAGLNPGDPVRMGTETYTFVGVRTKAPVFPIVVSNQKGRLYRFRIWAVNVDPSA